MVIYVFYQLGLFMEFVILQFHNSLAQVDYSTKPLPFSCGQGCVGSACSAIVNKSYSNVSARYLCAANFLRRVLKPPELGFESSNVSNKICRC